MSVYKYIILGVVIFFMTSASDCFAVADSVVEKVFNMPDDTLKVIALLDLAGEYGGRQDSLYQQKLNDALLLSKDISYQRGLVMCYDEVAYRHRNRSEFKEALEGHLKALKLAEKIGFKKYLSRIYNNIGVVYRRLDDYGSAVSFHIAALEISQIVGDNKSAMYASNSLGNVFMLLSQYDQAMVYFQQALLQAHEQKNMRSLAINYNNIGELYEKQQQFDDALKYYFKSLEYNQQNNSKRGVAISYDCIGSVYMSMYQYEKALTYFEKALVINQEIGDRIYESVSLLNVGQAHNSMGRENQAIVYLNNSLHVASEIGTKSVVRDAHQILSQIYEKRGNLAKSLWHYKEYTTFKDFVLNESNTKNISKLQTLYDTEKQRKEIAVLEQEKLQREKMGRRKTLFIVFLTVAFGLLGLFAIVLYRANIIKRRNNQILRKQSLLISEKNGELVQQKKQVELINDKITDSIQYAERIQQAILPQKEVLRKLFRDYFIFFKPLSVVSGDFYWVGEYFNKILFAVSDCTGHGVPGAMMSMLGNSYLNEVIRKPEITRTNQILDEMRSMIISSLHQQGGVGESKDGMEMSLCIYDKETKRLEFSGSHTSILVATKGQAQQYSIVELKGDVMPIGYYRKMVPFTSQTYEVKDADVIYLFSDGFVDQFGGPKERRFQRRYFKELLLKNAHKSLTEQSRIINETFVSWKGAGEQIDDVLVLGVKLPMD